jgi:FixJ family two-component response regulator
MSQAPVTIALVEDHGPIRESLAHLLTLAGYQVRSFPSGEDFAAAAEGGAFDCMLLDVELGTCTGFDVAVHPAVKRLGATTIFMSGSPDPEIPVRAAEVGCAAFLPKPFVLGTLIEIIAQALQARNA